jgi:protein gp37
MAARLKAMGAPAYQNDGNRHTSGPGFALTLHPERLQAPLQWRKPSLVFVNSMSDLFHAKVPFEFVEQVWDVMARTPQHTYQILTKRPDRMARFSERLPLLPNVWLGTSIEDQARVAGRLRNLCFTHAAVIFISAEPLLGPIDFGPALHLVDWVIAGGESGPSARPCEEVWLRSIREQCQDRGAYFFLKQLGGHPDKRGHDKALLDGRLWREMPEVAA